METSNPTEHEVNQQWAHTYRGGGSNPHNIAVNGVVAQSGAERIRIRFYWEKNKARGVEKQEPRGNENIPEGRQKEQ